MIDANDGYNLNMAKRVLAETEGVYWIEEAFREDPVLYANLKEWMQLEGIDCRIADGEGDASKHIQEWAQKGIIDILQYDLRQYGFTAWVEMGARFDSWGVSSAPHNYGEATANYYACHLAGIIKGFESVEWDEARIEGISAYGYSISSGLVDVQDLPGFGLDLDETAFAAAVRADGFAAS